MFQIYLVETEAGESVNYGKAASTKFIRKSSSCITTIKIKFYFNSLSRHMEIGR